MQAVDVDEDNCALGKELAVNPVVCKFCQQMRDRGIKRSAAYLLSTYAERPSARQASSAVLLSHR
jgi:hypothetical protein